MNTPKIYGFVLGMVSSLIGFVALELLSAACLYFVLPKNEPTALFRTFPAQLRMSRKERDDEFKQLYTLFPIAQPQQFFQFEYDPVLGFRNFEYLVWHSPSKSIKLASFQSPEASLHQSLNHWIGELVKELSSYSNPFLIVALGGSTTVDGLGQPNWPGFLIEKAVEQRVNRPIVVLNAGMHGYGLLQEQILYSKWILPILESKGIKPELVISFDGINDSYTPMLSEHFAKLYKTKNWYPQYHVYHQQLDYEINHILHKKPSFISLSPQDLIIKQFLRIARGLIPYTTRLSLFLINNKLNQHPDIKSRYTDPTLVKDEKSEERWYPIEAKSVNRVVSGHRGHLLDLKALNNVRGIDYESFLQPIFLPRYYPGPVHPAAVFPNINHCPRHTLNHRIGGDFLLDMDKVYPTVETLYSDLSKKYPTDFVNIADAFKEFQNETNYAADSLHYTINGAKIIAQKIVAHNLKVGRFSRSQIRGRILN